MTVTRFPEDIDSPLAKKRYWVGAESASLLAAACCSEALFRDPDTPRRCVELAEQLYELLENIDLP